MYLLPGVQMLIVPPAMPLTPRPLAPLALRLVEIPGIPRVRGVQAVGLARLPTLIRGGATPLPARHAHASTPHQWRHRSQARRARPPEHAITIKHTTNRARRVANKTATPPPPPPSDARRAHTTRHHRRALGLGTPAHGITKYLRGTSVTIPSDVRRRC